VLPWTAGDGDGDDDGEEARGAFAVAKSPRKGAAGEKRALSSALERREIFRRRFGGIRTGSSCSCLRRLEMSQSVTSASDVDLLTVRGCLSTYTLTRAHGWTPRGQVGRVPLLVEETE